jgi:hypothetical protein
MFTTFRGVVGRETFNQHWPSKWGVPDANTDNADIYRFLDVGQSTTEHNAVGKPIECSIQQWATLTGEQSLEDPNSVRTLHGATPKEGQRCLTEKVCQMLISTLKRGKVP